MNKAVNFDMLPEDVRQQILALRQRQQALRAQAMAPLPDLPTQTASGGFAVRNSPLSHLANLLEKRWAQQGASHIDTRANELTAQGMGGFTPELEKVYELRNGIQGQTYNERGGEAVSSTVPANPRAAITAALTSRRPGIQSLGQQMQESLFEQEKEQAKARTSALNAQTQKLFEDATPESQQAYMRDGSRNMNLLVPRGKTTVLGDAIVNVNESTGAVRPLTQNRFATGSQSVPGTGSVTTTRDTYSGRETPNAQLTANITLDRELKDTIGKKEIEGLAKSQEAAQGAERMLSIVRNASGLLDKGIVGGLWADKRVAVESFAKLFGREISQEALNSENLGRVLGDLVLTALNEYQLKPVSNTDLEYLEKLRGMSGNDPQTIAKMLNDTAKFAMRNLVTHAGRLQDAERRLGKLGGNQYDLGAFGLPSVGKSDVDPSMGYVFKDPEGILDTVMQRLGPLMQDKPKPAARRENFKGAR